LVVSLTLVDSGTPKFASLVGGSDGLCRCDIPQLTSGNCIMFFFVMSLGLSYPDIDISRLKQLPVRLFFPQQDRPPK